MNSERIAYTEVEVEALTGIKRKTLQGWRLRRQGPRYIKVGRRLVRYPAEDLHGWINSRSGGGESLSNPLTQRR
jgi:predicted DNA-binding transcriptional regulator AlpA